MIYIKPVALEDKMLSYEKVMQAKNVTIGTKQTLRALKADQVLEVFIAEDAEARVVNPVISLANEKQVPINKVDSMKKLGKACGIDVGAATAAILK